MKWDEMTPEQRDAHIAEKVMGWEQAMPYEAFHRYLWKREDAPGLTKETPPFTQSMDAAWLALKKLNEELTYRQIDVFTEEMKALFPDEVVYNDWDEGGITLKGLMQLTPEMLCRAILKAIGIDLEKEG